jgi:uncharacterized membrane protein
MPKKNWIEQEITTDRIIGFSDAIFAFAITLLALNIDIPQGIPYDQFIPTMQLLGTHIEKYIISFIVIASFWIGHHRMFEHIKRYDSMLIWLNLLFLVSITFMPVLTDMLSDYSSHQMPVIIYAAALGTASLILGIVWWHATRKHLVDPNVDDEEIKYNHLRSIVVSCVFYLSIPVSFFSLGLAELMWILVLLVSPIVSYLYERRRRENAGKR